MSSAVAALSEGGGGGGGAARRHWAVLRRALLRKAPSTSDHDADNCAGITKELFIRTSGPWEPELRLRVTNGWPITEEQLLRRIRHKSGSPANAETLGAAVTLHLEAWDTDAIATMTGLANALVGGHKADILKVQTASSSSPDQGKVTMQPGDNTDDDDYDDDNEHPEEEGVDCAAAAAATPSTGGVGMVMSLRVPCPSSCPAYDFVEYMIDTPRRDKPVKLRVRQRRASQPVPLTEALSHRTCGVDNTGNVRVWPAEEVLLHLMTRHPHTTGMAGVMMGGGPPLTQQQLPPAQEAPRPPPHDSRWWEGKTVLELGGGMTGLAGLGVARCLPVSRVVITDGNSSCVDNMQVCILLNWRKHKTPVHCQRLLWAAEQESEGSERKATVAALLEEKNGGKPFDVILAADCLFFEDFHDGLISVLQQALVPDTGVAWLLQPDRGLSMANFIAKATATGTTSASPRRLDVQVVGQLGGGGDAEDYYRLRPCVPGGAASSSSSPPSVLKLLRVRSCTTTATTSIGINSSSAVNMTPGATFRSPGPSPPPPASSIV